MIKSDVFVTRLARGAAASTLAICLVPQIHTDDTATRGAVMDATITDRTTTRDQSVQVGTDGAIHFSVQPMVSEWEIHMEKEFRKLALEEAKGTITGAQVKRLEQLNQWRDRLLNPQSAEELLKQIKRDRLLAKTEELLNEYVELQKPTDNTRTAA
jgi:hypothetical protein